MTGEPFSFLDQSEQILIFSPKVQLLWLAYIPFDLADNRYRTCYTLPAVGRQPRRRVRTKSAQFFEETGV